MSTEQIQCPYCKYSVPHGSDWEFDADDVECPECEKEFSYTGEIFQTVYYTSQCKTCTFGPWTLKPKFVNDTDYQRRICQVCEKTQYEVL